MKNKAVASAPEAVITSGPLTPAEADRLFLDFQRYTSLALGVSGGADSVCLLRLLRDWQLRTGWSGRLIVFTVDHGLRAESPQEAAFVGEICQAVGISHRTLAWTGDKQAGNLQGEARHARYRLMAEAMKEVHAEALVLAHHQDDQVETFLDRLTRGSGVYGLGAMQRIEQSGPMGLQILRPLLAVPKQRLEATLQEIGQLWCEDPSNSSDAYKRVRLRKLAAELAEEGLDTSRLLDTANRLRRAASAIDAWVERVLSEDVREHPSGPLALDYRHYVLLPEEVRLRLLSRLVQRVSGQDYPARLVKLEALDCRLRETVPGKHTLAGAVVCRSSEHLLIWREAGRKVPEGNVLTGGGDNIWDNRYRVEVEASGPDMSGLVVGPLCRAPAVNEAFEFPDGWPKSAFDCAPAVWRESDLLLVPGLFRSKQPLAQAVHVSPTLKT